MMDEFILALFQENDKLRMSTLYQILVGKKSASMLYYAFQHHLLDIVGLLPNLRKDEFEKTIYQLCKQKHLILNEGELTCLNNRHFLLSVEPYSHLNHYRLKNSLQLWRLLQLLISYLSYWPKDYQGPILENSPFYLMNVNRMMANMTNKTKMAIYQELVDIFSEMPAAQADFLAQTLSGESIQGHTFYQLLPDGLQSPFDTCYIFACVEHFWTQVMQKNETQLFQYFKPFILKNYKYSMLVTRQLYKQGKSIEQIVQIRKLKEGTINDHLIEWAIGDDKFPFHQFQLLPLTEEVLQYRYKELTEQRPDVSFLQYRLSQIAFLKGRKANE